MNKSTNKKIIISFLILILSFGFFQAAEAVIKAIGETATIIVTCSDPDANLSQCNVTSPVDPTDTGPSDGICPESCPVSPPSGSGSCSCTYTCLVEGTYNACGEARDILGPYGYTVTECLDVVICNNSPSALNLSVDDFEDTVCGIISGARVRLKWEFSDLDLGDTQSAYRLEIATDSGFSNIVVRSCDPNLTDPDARCMPSEEFVNDPPSYSLLPWDQPYYWRLKVWDSDNLESSWIYPPSPPGSPSPAPGEPFTTPLHAYPYIDFSRVPEKPSVNEVVEFTDLSEVYGGATKSSWYWTFQDGDPSTFSSNTTGTATTTFTSTGPKEVTLTVTDSPTGYSCPGSKTINPTLPLPQWREIAPF